MRKLTRAGALVLVTAFLLMAGPTQAEFPYTFSLTDGIKRSKYIFMARVEQFDADKGKMVLVVGEQLKKDKPPLAKLPITFAKPDEDAREEEHVPKLMKRLANDLPIVVFVNDLRGNTVGVAAARVDLAKAKQEAMAYTNGTWF